MKMDIGGCVSLSAWSSGIRFVADTRDTQGEEGWRLPGQISAEGPIGRMAL